MNKIFLILACLLLAAQPSAADAYSCVAQTNAIDPFVQADIVFIGRIRDVQGKVKYNVDVGTVYKGDLKDSLILDQQTNILNTEAFEVGVEYLIFADQKENGYTAESCRGTKRISKAAEDLGLLSLVSTSKEQAVVDGLKTAVIKYYFQGDQLLEQQSFADGKKHGLFSGYKLIGYKLYDKEYRLGLLDGESVEYFDTGDMKLQRSYKQGQMHGTNTLFNSDGSIKIQQVYDMGQPVN